MLNYKVISIAINSTNKLEGLIIYPVDIQI